MREKNIMGRELFPADLIAFVDFHKHYSGEGLSGVSVIPILKKTVKPNPVRLYIG